jgi:aspartate aminotransferase-like enzyme
VKVRCILHNDHGIEISGGFGQLAGKIFRIGIMGPLATPDHVDDFLAKFSKALSHAGYKG